MGKYGFVYIWRDRKHSRFYVGSHWGKEDDGYICSSRWMRKARARRTGDFRRRVIERVHTCLNDLLTVEHKWLSLIKKEELGNRYYNLCNFRFGHWATDEASLLSVGRKISLKNTGRKDTPEGRQRKSYAQKRRYSDPKVRAAHSLRMMGINKGKSSPFKGQKKSEEFRNKISAGKQAKNGQPSLKQRAAEFGISVPAYLRRSRNGDLHLSNEERQARANKRTSETLSGKPRPYRRGIPSPLKGIARSKEVREKISAVKKANSALRKATAQPKVQPWEIEGISRSKWYRDRKA